MAQPPTHAEARLLYDQIVARALFHAARRVPRSDALELAHDVACELVRRRLEGLDDADDPRPYEGLIYRAVWNRLNNLKRGSDRRAAAERVHLDERERSAPSWVSADGEVVAEELSRLIEDAIAEMPDAMRQVFLLVRVEQLSYKEASTKLNIGVGTVHTQLARASQRLRLVVDRYRSESSSAAHPTQSGRNSQ